MALLSAFENVVLLLLASVILDDTSAVFCSSIGNVLFLSGYLQELFDLNINKFNYDVFWWEFLTYPT